MNIDEITKIKAQAEDDLLKRPGVTAVDVGYKYIGGVKTNEIAIRVHVEKKKKDVPKAELIPKEIDGVKTDVLERTYELQTAMLPVDQIELQVDTGTYNPVQGGIGIGPCRAVGGFVYVGTLGAIVRDNVSHQPMLLSNFHVMCIDNGWHVGDTMAQPGRVDGGTCPASVVGALQRASLGGHVDCAVSSLSGRGSQCDIVDIGNVAGTGTATLGMPVRKRGRTTGLTYGTVDSVALTVTINYGAAIGNVTLTNQIGITVDPAHSAKIGDHGDSGSAVVDNSRRVVGLYFAGSTDGQHGIANPIADVLAALNVSMCVPVIKFKEIAKEIKVEKLELKDHKLEKIEHKELKVERKELKPELEKLHPDKFRKELEKLQPDKFQKEKGEFEGKPGGLEHPGDPLGPLRPPVSGPLADEMADFVPQAGRNCVDFRTLAPKTGPNPLTTGGWEFTVHQFGGTQPPDYAISTWGGITGLNCGFETEIKRLGDPCPFVSITLAHFSQPAKIEAFNDDGSLAGAKVMTAAQHTAQTFTFSGTIRRVVVVAPSDELLLIELCCGAKETLKVEKPELKDIGKEKETIKAEKPEPKEKPEKIEQEKDISPKVEKDKHEKESKEHKLEKREKEKHEKDKHEKESKEHKLEKPEKDKHEKESKNELKERKLEKPEKDKHEKESKNELKEHKLEKPEKDKHEKESKLEPKELKLEPKELAKEKEQTKLESADKGLQPKEKSEKELVEGPGGVDPGELLPGSAAAFAAGYDFDYGNPFAAQGDSLGHFIGSELRPDLSQGALRQEEDLDY